MNRSRSLRVLVLVASALAPGTVAWAQGAAADYERANGQLIKHNKDFDLLYIPGAGHGPGGAYGERKRCDFFVRHLLGVNLAARTDKERATQ